jgi:Flp pilus assembly protein TadD
VLLQMTGAFWRCAFVAAVFAIHPLRVESVAWVSERKDVLSGLFFFLTIGAYVRYARQPWSITRYGLVTLLFAAGLLCKPMLVTLPIILLLLDYWPLQRKKPWVSLVVEKLPLLALVAGSCVITILAQRQGIRSFEAYPLGARITGAMLSYQTYLVQMVYPAHLAAFYPFPHSVPVWETLLAALLLAGLSLLAFVKRQTNPWLLMGWLWYLVMLVPVVGIIQVGAQAHADRYTYLPQIGIYIALTWLVAELAVRWHINASALGGFMGATIVALMVCSWKQTGYWKNSPALWQRALACYPDNDLACVNLGNELVQSGQLEEAINLYKKASQIDPGNVEYESNLADALRENGKMDEALIHYKNASELKPDSPEVQYNLGQALRQNGKTEEAMSRFQIVLQIKPDFAPARRNIGYILLQQGKADEAEAQFQKLVELNPNDPDTHLYLGLCLFQLGKMAEARSQYEQALQINPADPQIQNSLAWLLAACPVASLRDGNEAVELARESNEITGGADPAVLHILAAALAQDGRYSEAVQTAQQALSLAQSNPALAKQLQYELRFYNADKSLPAAGKVVSN